MSLGTSNRDGGKTSESGHLRAESKVVSGDILEGLISTQRGAGANMSIDISVGDAFVRRADGSYAHPVFNDAVYNQVISTADSTNPRRDIVVMYVDYAVTPTTASSNNINGVVKIKVVNGSPAGSPVDPTDTAIQASVGSGNPFTKLSRVRVPAGQTSISNSLIDDLRVMSFPKMDVPTKNNYLNGWLDANETWTFSSWNATNKVGIVTVPTDATQRYAIDMLVRFSQATGGTKYGRIIGVTATTITIWIPNFTLNNETILVPFFSMLANPFGPSKALTAGNPYRFFAYKSADQTLTTSLQKNIFDVKGYDATGNYDTANSRFIAPIAGLYAFTYNAQLSNGSTQLTQYIRYQVNGTPAKEFAVVSLNTNGGGQAAVQFELNAGDYVEIFSNLSTGSFISIGGQLYSHFAGHYLGAK